MCINTEVRLRGFKVQEASVVHGPLNMVVTATHPSTRSLSTSSSLVPYVMRTGVPVAAAAADGAWLLLLLVFKLASCASVSFRSPDAIATTLHHGLTSRGSKGDGNDYVPACYC